MFNQSSLTFRKFIPGIAWFFFVLILICLPGDDLPQPDSWMTLIYFDKWVHAGLFSILAFLFMRPVSLSSIGRQQKINTILKIAISLSLWGLTTEFIQKYFIRGRSFDPLDWAADTAGVLLAFAACRKIYQKHFQ